LNEPDPSFFTLKLNVANFLAFSGQRDYDATLVDRIATYLRDHPITLGYDFEVYWRLFVTGRAEHASENSQRPC